VDASLGREQFVDEIVAAWLVFYVQAQRAPEAARLLRIYAKRMHSNLMFNLRQLVDEPAATNIAQGTASLIDGIYIRHALANEMPSRPQARALVQDYLDMNIERHRVRAARAH